MSWLKRFLDAFRGDADAPPAGDPERVAAVERVLAELRPAVALDGGDVRLVAVEDGWVVVRLEGACRSCYARSQTLDEALAPRLREALPWFEGLRAR